MMGLAFGAAFRPHPVPKRGGSFTRALLTFRSVREVGGKPWEGLWWVLGAWGWVGVHGGHAWGGSVPPPVAPSTARLAALRPHGGMHPHRAVRAWQGRRDRRLLARAITSNPRARTNRS